MGSHGLVGADDAAAAGSAVLAGFEGFSVMARYALIIVTNAGAVSYTPGFPTLELCRDAESLARTGRTVAEEAEYASKAVVGSNTLRLRSVDLSGVKWSRCVIEPEETP